LTASGAALGLLALLLAIDGAWEAMFVCLGAAALVDGIDGPLARRLNVGELAPRWSGDTLDLVVDFITYVFVPAYAIGASGLIPDLLALPAACAIVVSGALYFADRNMKTADNYFLGFPAVWNVVAFYIFALAPNEWVVVLAIVAFVALTFAPVKFVHPLRVRNVRSLTLGMLIAWGVFALFALVQALEPDLWVRVGLLVTAIYFLGIGFVARQK
jgi:phosphatidylcholine synthase